jgi:D-alanyl-D-alanine carboxypeptidase
MSGLAGILTALALLLGVEPAAAQPQYAAIISEADTGRVLYEFNADSDIHPASLAKMMTLYLAFEDLRSGKLSPSRQLLVSRHAAAQPASRLGLKKGTRIEARSAILALVTKSANDAASVLAEGMAGTEDAFARRMNGKARALGMKYTRFRNASGLHEPLQVTTARDMMVLARALLRDFPDQSRLFSVREFKHEGRIHKNHNGLLGAYAGTDGIKTGYIRAAGFHLAASVHREGSHLLGIVLGGRNAAVRDLNMIYLFERAFARLRVEKLGGALTEAAVKRPSIAAAEFELAALPAAFVGEGDGTVLDEWGVQVGAFSEPASAQASGKKAAQLVPDILEQATLSVLRIDSHLGHTLHRARVVGITRGEALQACARLQNFRLACLPVEPGGIKTFN